LISGAAPMKSQNRKFGNGPALTEHAWNFYSRFYDIAHPFLIRLTGAFGSLSYDEFQEEFVELARPKPGQAVIDVACGTGAGFAALGRAVGPEGEIVAVDISADMLYRARARARRLKLKNVTYRAIDAEKLSLHFDEESFDLALSCNGPPNFLHPRRAVVEMSYVLREGGTLAFSTLDRRKCDDIALFRWSMRYPEARFPYEEQYRETLEKLGFTKITSHRRGLMLIVTARKTPSGSTRRRRASTRRKSAASGHP